MIGVTIREYVDLRGFTNTAVDGPNGTWLITARGYREGWNVWKSDSINPPTVEAALGRAIIYATKLATR